MIRYFYQKNVIHYFPNIAFYSVKFPTVRILSFRGHIMFLKFGIEFSKDFKIKKMKTINEVIDLLTITVLIDGLNLILR